MTPTEDEVKELHSLARELTEFFKNKGLTSNKKYLRYNTIVETAIKYGSLGKTYEHNYALSGMKEVVESCFKETAMYSDKSGPEGIVYDWMLPEWYWKQKDPSKLLQKDTYKVSQ